MKIKKSMASVKRRELKALDRKKKQRRRREIFLSKQPKKEEPVSETKWRDLGDGERVGIVKTSTGQQWLCHIGPQPEVLRRK